MYSLSGMEDSLQCPPTRSPFISDESVINNDTAMSEQKKCTRCNLIKSLSDFGVNKQAKDGKSYWCLQCKREYSKEYRLTTNGIYNQLVGRNNFYKRHPLIISRERFVEWYDNEPKTCHYCGVPSEHLEQFMRFYKSRWYRLTIDCKDSPTGYADGNIVLACDKCNMVKQNILSYEDMLYVGKHFIKPKWKTLIMESTTKIGEDK